jgi:hypothetical protein
LSSPFLRFAVNRFVAAHCYNIAPKVRSGFKIRASGFPIAIFAIVTAFASA